MKHPAPETWIEYVYDELPPAARADAEAHCQVCPQCQKTVQNLRSTLTRLDQDKASLVVPRRRSTGWAPPPILRWAMAASVVLCAGFLAGRSSRPSREDLQREVAAVRQELQAQFREELKTASAVSVAASTDENRRLLTEFARELQAGRSADRKDLLSALEALDQRRALDTEALRAGLLTLARQTGTGFQQTDSQLNLLASYLPAEPLSASETSSGTPQEP